MEVTINGIKTNYQVFGEGKPFLILHGWGSASDRWIKEAEIISVKGFQVIIPDLPGFGASDKLTRPWTINDYVKWFEEFVKNLNIENFYLLGYSFGGALAAKISVKYPQRVQKLFLVAAALVRKKTTQKNLSAKISKFIKLFYFLPYYGFFRKAVYKFIIRKSDYVYTEGIMTQTYLNAISDDISFNLPFIKVPTIIIWGDKDQSVPVENAYFANEKIKNSKLVIIPGADHLIHKQLPEVLAGKILENI
ncbi:MAG: alpha/beta hydrolase [Candidatus Staskawiczbacteria bacterium]|jgi:pimeloyl-ACP methyl ester carboxylesterase